MSNLVPSNWSGGLGLNGRHAVDQRLQGISLQQPFLIRVTASLIINGLQVLCFNIIILINTKPVGQKAVIYKSELYKTTLETAVKALTMVGFINTII